MIDYTPTINLNDIPNPLRSNLDWYLTLTSGDDIVSVEVELDNELGLEPLSSFQNFLRFNGFTGDKIKVIFE